jgi:hypothetical protein
MMSDGSSEHADMIKDMPCQCGDCPSPTHVARLAVGTVNAKTIGIAQCSATVGTSTKDFVDVDDARLGKIWICQGCHEARR